MRCVTLGYSVLYFRKVFPISSYSTIDLQTARDNKYKIIPKVGIYFYKGKPF